MVPRGSARRRGRVRPLFGAFALSTLILGGAVGTVAAADPPPPLDPPPALEPIDPQEVVQAVDQDWSDYSPIPGSPYADPSIEPEIERWNVALILTDFPGTPFAVTQPQGSTIFGNPGPLAHDLPREAVPAFYRDWLNVPSAMNEFQGMNRYWMETSFGKYGVALEGYGPYLLYGSQDEYFINDFANPNFCNTQTRTVGAQANALDIAVQSTASFSVGKILTGFGGGNLSRVVVDIPDATHLRTAASTTIPNNASALAGDTVIKVTSVAGIAVGDVLQIGYGDRLETRTVGAVGTSGSGGTGITLTEALAFGHFQQTIVRNTIASPLATVADNVLIHSCGRSYRNETAVAWADHIPLDERQAYDNTFYVAAGQDESGTWQEFGEMQFTQFAVPDSHGPSNSALENWAQTRYIPWTSWVSAATIWPSASGNNSIEGEGSGMAVYAHELTHNLGIGDNYNNPYANPFQRPATGYWSMMSRGSFGGPGGTHNRWHIPSTLGTALGSQHVLRDKVKLGFVEPENFVELNRNGLAATGLAVLEVTAREVDPGASDQTGVRILLDGAAPIDKTLGCAVFTKTLAAPAAAGDTTVKVDSVTQIVAGLTVTVGTPANGETRVVAAVGTAGPDGTGITLTQPLAGDHAAGEAFSNRLNCSGNPTFTNYTVEVVQRVGSDSFQADNGVLIMKNKVSEGSSCFSFTCFAWVIDAHPEDINLVDFVRPDGTIQQVTTGDPRQLTDAAFHAGLNSGSLSEWEETANGLHFYVVDRHLGPDGVLRYTIAVQNINGAGPHTRGTVVDDAPDISVAQRWTTCTFPLTNSGVAGTIEGTPHTDNDPGLHNRDVYRLSVGATGAGWQAQLANALATAAFGETIAVPVYVTRDEGSDATATVSLTATSVSDPTKTSTAECALTVPPPTIEAQLDPAEPNGDNGWYNSGDVDLTFLVTDATSIVGCVDETFSTDGIFERSCEATSDGGTTGPVIVTVMRDTADPEVGVTGVEDGAVYVLGAVPEADCEASDETSGVADGSPSLAITGGPIVGFFTATCSATDVAGNDASASVDYQVIYDFTGFVGFVKNPPAVNGPIAGQAVAVKFSLAGDQGLVVLDGAPTFQRTSCTTGDPIGGPIDTTTAAPFWYDPDTDAYTYPWKTNKSWKGWCGTLTVALIDGTSHSALFRFK